MSSVVAERLGVPTPRVLVRPLGLVDERPGDDAARLIGLVGVTLDEWQLEVLRIAMGLTASEKWAAKTVDIIASRQNGKNVILEARELYGAVVLGEQIVHTAHLFATAKKSFKRIKKLVAANPELRDRLVQQYASPATGYSFEFRDGGLIEFIARQGGSGRGFTGDLLILDEAQNLGEEELGALLPTLSATSIDGDPQVWYTGTAPMVSSTVWQRRRSVGRAGTAKSSAYFEFSADPDCDLDDRAAWAQANPGLGLHISEEFIEETERSSMSDVLFAQERLSISPEVNVAGGPFGPVAWDRVNDPDLVVVPELFALDANPERTFAGLVGIGVGPTVSVVDYRSGVSWLPAKIAELRKKYPKARFVVDRGGPASSLIPELQLARVPLIELEPRDYPRACGAFFDRVLDGEVKFRRDGGLDASVAGAAKRWQGEGWVWGRKTPTADASLLVASTIGVWALDKRPKKPGVAGDVDPGAYDAALAQIQKEEADALESLGSG